MSEQGNIDFQKKLLTAIYQKCSIVSAVVNSDFASKELYFIFVVNGSVGLIQHWLKNGMKESSKELAGVIYDMSECVIKQ
jgi:hypothetical protein